MNGPYHSLWECWLQLRYRILNFTNIKLFLIVNLGIYGKANADGFGPSLVLGPET
jgi:hypothetical protein